jgi:ATP-binding cassette subfamily B protein
MSRVTSDSERIAQLVTWGLLDVTWGLLNIGTAVYFMLVINWQLALIVLMMIPILIIIAAQFKKKILLQFRLVRNINSKLTGAYNEQIAGVRVIKALNREVKSLDEFSELTSEMYNSADSRNHNRRYSGIYLLHHFHDVADPRFGPSLRRNAARNRIR